MDTKTTIMALLGGLVMGGLLILVVVMFSATTSKAGLKKFKPDTWPPKVGRTFPDLELIDQKGRSFKISDYKGKVLLIEPVGMSCTACQAFSGGHNVGAFQGNGVQENVLSVSETLPRYLNGTNNSGAFHEDLVFIQIIFYDMERKAPLPAHAEIWAEHFRLRKHDHEIVAVSPYDMRSRTTKRQIPGLYLVDKSQTLRANAAGNRAPDSLYKKLFPMIKGLVGE